MNVAAESVEMASTWVHDRLLFNRGLRNNILNLSQVRGLNHVAAAAKPASQSSGGGGGVRKGSNSNIKAAPLHQLNAAAPPLPAAIKPTDTRARDGQAEDVAPLISIDQGLIRCDV